MTTAIVPVDRRTDAAAFEPANIDEALSVSKLLVSSRLLPRSITTPEAAFAVIVTGRELGLSAMQALRSVHIVEGKPTLSADLMVALVKRSDACLFFRLVESSGTIATYETHRRGEPSPTRLSFSMDQAKAAGVASKDNWRKFPDAMLRARAAAALARAVYPDLVLGVYDPDELAPVVDVTPAPAPAPVASVRVEAPAPVAVEPAPTPAPRRRKSEAAPAPAPAPVVEDVVDVEPVDVAHAEPVAEESAAPAGLVAEIAAAANLAAARKIVEAASLGDLSSEMIRSVFGALLERAHTPSECNDVAATIVARKGVLGGANVESLRALYLARKSALTAKGA